MTTAVLIRPVDTGGHYLPPVRARSQITGTTRTIMFIIAASTTLAGRVTTLTLADSDPLRFPAGNVTDVSLETIAA